MVLDFMLIVCVVDLFIHGLQVAKESLSQHLVHALHVSWFITILAGTLSTYIPHVSAYYVS